MKNEMKVLFITHYISIYGANIAMLSLIKCLRDRHGIVPFVLLPGYGELESVLKEEGIRYVVSGFVPSKQGQKMSVFKSLMKKIKTPYYYARVLYRLKNEKFDIIHTNSSVINIGALLHLALRKPHVWHLREFGDGLDYHIYQNLGKSYERFVFNKGADRFIAISESIKEYYSDRITKVEVSRIYDGVPSVGRMVAKHSNREVNFVCVGCLCGGKNQMQLINASSILVNVLNVKDFRLNIIGNGEVEYDLELRKKVSEGGLEKYVNFWGYRTDVKNILAKMDVGVIASRSEGFGLVTVEYMLHGLPVLGTNAGATKELIKDGCNGFVFELDNAEDLANRMKYFIDNRPEIVKFGENGLQIAQTEYSVEKNAEAVYSCYKTVLGDEG